jgi:hypothetical protein
MTTNKRIDKFIITKDQLDDITALICSEPGNEIDVDKRSAYSDILRDVYKNEYDPQKIRNSVMDEFGILHGEDAERFHKMMMENNK